MKYIINKEIKPKPPIDKINRIMSRMWMILSLKILNYLKGF